MNENFNLQRFKEAQERDYDELQDKYHPKDIMVIWDFKNGSFNSIN